VHFSWRESRHRRIWRRPKIPIDHRRSSVGDALAGQHREAGGRSKAYWRLRRIRNERLQGEHTNRDDERDPHQPFGPPCRCTDTLGSSAYPLLEHVVEHVLEHAASSLAQLAQRVVGRNKGCHLLPNNRWVHVTYQGALLLVVASIKLSIARLVMALRGGGFARRGFAPSADATATSETTATRSRSLHRPYLGSGSWSSRTSLADMASPRDPDATAL
jgi:hypothetical protein